jgi:DNA polymerase III sliding clamp (beta) subunit (PCNA family)
MAFVADAEAGATLQLAGTNLKMALETTIPADVTDAGKLLVSVKPLSRIVKSLTSEEVSMTLDGSSLIVKGVGTARTHKLPTRPADEMPKIPLPPKDGAITVQASVFRGLVNRVSHASDPAPNTGRSGVMVEITGEVIAVAAANGYQLAAVESASGCAADTKWERLIPSLMHRALGEICEDSQTLQINQDENHIYVETDESMIACMTPMEPFVPWRNVLKMIEPRSIATVSSEALTQAIKGVTCVKPDSVISLKFSKQLSDITKPGRVKIEMVTDFTADAELGAVDIVECDSVERDTELYISAPLLLANIKSAATDVVSIKLSEPNHLTVTSGDYKALVALVQKPTKISEAEKKVEEKPAKKGAKK